MKTFHDLISHTKKFGQYGILPFLLIAGIVVIIIIDLSYKVMSVNKLHTVTANEINSIQQVTQHSLQSSTISTIAIKTTQPPLFGVAPTEAGAALNSLYTLIGTKYSPSNPKNAMAFIRIDSDDSEVYFIGDTLPKGGKIENIDEASITVLYRGLKEKLQVPWDTMTNLNDDTTSSSMMQEETALPHSTGEQYGR